MIIITGASDGLGLATAKLLTSEGKNCVCLSRSKPPIDIAHISTDLSSADSVNSAIRQILTMDQPIEALINSAGIEDLQEIDNLSYDRIDEVFRVNLIGAMQLVSGLLDKMRKDGSDIINIASTVGLKQAVGHTSYIVSKAAMIAFTDQLHAELKGGNNRVVNFVPGGMANNMVKKITGQDLANPSEWMDPDEIAKIIKFILDTPKNIEISKIVINRRNAR
jgi:NADP-dependent 3-hydroxy acid dehydrogenase YdfG